MPATAIGTYATASAIKARLAITDTTDDTLIGLVADQVNQYIESPQGTGRVLAPVSSTVFLIDGDGTSRFYFPRGIRAITALSVGDYTGDTKDAVASTDYFLRPLVQDRESGWPAMWVELSDRPTGTPARRTFPTGYENVSMTATTGWAAIPDDIIDVALTMAVRAWRARQTGQADVVGSDDLGQPVVSRYLSSRDRETLKKYRVVVPPG